MLQICSYNNQSDQCDDRGKRCFRDQKLVGQHNHITINRVTVLYYNLYNIQKEFMNNSEEVTPIITFKPTTNNFQQYKHTYDSTQTVQHLKEVIATHYAVEYEQIKLIFKGKILADRETSQQAKLANGVVMLVINKKIEKPKKENTDQTIPRIPSSFNTGMGGSSPIGFGAYSMINHPQYMSAISGAVNEQKIEQIMNDPSSMALMQELMQDPETIKYMIEENPMLKNMFNQNPSMKMILENPALMKAVFNPESLKMARDVMKNQGNPSSTQSPQLPQSNPFGGLSNLSGMNNLGNLNSLGNLGAMQLPQMPQMPNQNANMQNQMGMPYFNPFMMGMRNPIFATQSNQSQLNGGQIPIQQKYKTQLRELQSMGFKDREENIKALIESKGDVDGAIERLCKD